MDVFYTLFDLHKFQWLFLYKLNLIFIKGKVMRQHKLELGRSLYKLNLIFIKGKVMRQHKLELGRSLSTIVTIEHYRKGCVMQNIFSYFVYKNKFTILTHLPYPMYSQIDANALSPPCFFPGFLSVLYNYTQDRCDVQELYDWIVIAALT